MTLPEGWRRVSRAHPCRVCGKPDWCAVAPDGDVCSRTPSPRPLGEAGWLHNQTTQFDTAPFAPRCPRIDARPKPIRDWVRLSAQYTASLNGYGGKLAESLGVTERSLNSLGVGWADEHNAWSFPMVGADGIVCGIRLRGPDGSKWSVTGSTSGLFVPSDPYGDGAILIVEGPTDCAAAWSLGFDAVGRPSCRGAIDQTALAVKGRHVVVVADDDGPGTQGATELATALTRRGSLVRLILPGGFKDMRDWLRAGCARADVLGAIRNAVRFRPA